MYTQSEGCNTSISFCQIPSILPKRKANTPSRQTPEINSQPGIVQQILILCQTRALHSGLNLFTDQLMCLILPAEVALLHPQVILLPVQILSGDPIWSDLRIGLLLLYCSEYSLGKYNNLRVKPQHNIDKVKCAGNSPDRNLVFNLFNPEY
jgi:hypothetical protein